MSETNSLHRGGSQPATSRSVVIPVYDESPATWTGLVDDLHSRGWDEVVVAIDDPDPETRRSVGRLAGRADTTFSVASGRRGKGGALSDGLAAADGDVIGFVDADGAVDVSDLDCLYRAVERGVADVAVGSRDAPTASRDGQALHRRVLGAGYRRLARRVTGVDITDFQCGAKALHADVWRDVGDAVTETGFAFDTELVARAHHRGYDVTERPIQWRDPGDSDVNVIRDIPGLLGALVRLRRTIPDETGTVRSATATDIDATATDIDATDDDPVHVALVTDHPPNRGHLAEYGEELALAYSQRRDVEVTVLSRAVEDDFDSGDAPVELSRKNRPYDVERVWDRDSAAAGVQLLRTLRCGDFDAVQFNVHMTYFGTTNAYRFFGLSLPVLARLCLDCPVVTTLHDLLEVVEEERVAEEISTLERLGARVATQITLCSDATTVTAESYRDVIDDRYYGSGVTHVPHGTFTRADGAVPKITPPLRLLQFGFLGPTKDVETAVDAFRRIREAVADAELVIAGDSHPDFPGYRESLEDQFGDEPGVRFTGYVEDDELDGVWHNATLALMPYRTCTGVSGVFQLAKSYGKPVVAYDNDGMRTSTTETGGTASFVPPGDANALADRILELWDDRDRLDRMARENAEAGDEIPMTKTAERMLEVLVEHGGLDERRTEVTLDA